MENASKAIIISSSVLLAIMVLSIGVYLHSTLQGTAETYSQSFETAEIVKYNSYFEKYIDKEFIMAQDLVSLVEFAKKSGQGTEIYVDNIAGLENVNLTATDFDLMDFLEKYTFSEGYNPGEGRETINNIFVFNNNMDYDSSGKINIFRVRWESSKNKS